MQLRNALEQEQGAPEEEYRKFFFREDLLQWTLIIVLAQIPLIAFIASDYTLFGLSQTFYVLGIARSAFSVYCVVVLFILWKTKSQALFDRLSFSVSLLIVILMLYINSTRPAEYLGHLLFDVIVILVLYLMWTGSILFKALPALLLTAGSLVMLFCCKITSTPLSLYAATLSLVTANMVGLIISTRTSSYRRAQFQSQKQYLESNERLHALMQALPVGVIFSEDTSCHHITGNPCLFAQFDTSPQDDISKSVFYDVAAGSTVQFFLDGREITDAEFPLKRAIAENRTIPPIELEVRLSSGRHWITDASGAPIHDQQGKVIGGVAVTVDITERKQVEDELRRAHDELERRVRERTKELQLSNMELERSNADLQQFAYVASHDLQEPLRTITIVLQMLEKKHRGRFDEDSDLWIDFAITGAKKMRSLIQDLLAYSRLYPDGRSFQLVDMNGICDETLINLRNLVEEKGASITCHQMPTVFGDPIQLGQVIQNIVGNALKFSGGKSPRVQVSAKRNKDDWVFSVEDNGIGIDKEYFEQIFVIFQQLDRDMSNGTGIGLAIVKKIVERHGGQIWVESQSGIGSTFYFTIPAVIESNRL